MTARLKPTERVHGRPFADPEHSARDLSVLQYMWQRLGEVVSEPGNRADAPDLGTVPLPESAGRLHCATIARHEVLRHQQHFEVVGFFGHKRPEADPAPIYAIDKALIEEFGGHPGLLSYSRRELDDGGWANMVVLASAEDRAAWMASPRHVQAVRELAPRYYRSIRLHNALVARGLLSGGEMRLVRTKYYAFQGSQPWLGIREYPARRQ